MIVEKLLRVALLGSSWVLYVMIGLSVISIGVMLERAIYFMRRNVDVDDLGDELLKLMDKNDQEGAQTLLTEKSKRSIEAMVLAPAMIYLNANPDALEDAINSELVAARQEMERGTNLLGTLGNNAPFIGLFGTVIGVIIAFQQLSHTNGAGNMGNVMAGIAEALVATGVGLFVAIPAVVAYNVIQKRIGDVEGNVQALTKRVTAHLKAVESGWSRHGGSRRVHRVASTA